MSELQVRQVAIDSARLDFEATAGDLVNLVGPPRRRQRVVTVLAGRKRPDQGRITFADRDITDLAHDPRVSFAPQQTRIVESLTAAENVALPLLALRTDRADALERACALLARLAVAEPMHHNLAGELSGGQRQRVCLARAVISRPELLIADDPTSELDADSAVIVTDCLTELRQHGGIVVLATGSPLIEDCLSVTL